MFLLWNIIFWFHLIHLHQDRLELLSDQDLMHELLKISEGRDVRKYTWIIFSRLYLVLIGIFHAQATAG